MKETIFALMTFWLLAGCAETGEQRNPPKAEKQPFFKGFPIELQMPGDKRLPVEVQIKGDERIPVELKMPSDEPIPVKVQLQEEEGIPIKVEVKGDKALPVKLDMEGGEGLLVEVKLPQVALIYIAIFAATILIIAIVTCFAAVGAARSASSAFTGQRTADSEPER